MLRWLATNLRTFLLAFVLALAIWMTAVTAADPDETQLYPNPVPVEFIGLDPGLIMTGDGIPQQVNVTLRAPHSVWQKLLSSGVVVRAVVDLTSLESGSHKVQIQMQVDARPVRIVSIAPETFEVALEPQSTKTLTVVFSLTGNPAIGFQAGTPTLDSPRVIVSGAESLVSKVDHVQAGLDISNTRQNIDAPVTLQAVDANGAIISGIALMPDVVQVSVPVVQQGGYRDLAVKVMTVGNPVGGYSLTSVAAFPPIVTVYSANSSIIDSMPGYVETFPLDLNGAKAKIEEQLEINLPQGVTLIGDQSVLVQVGIAPIESSRTISRRLVDMIGLGSGLLSTVSPQTVDVILSGPLPELDALSADDIHVQVDLTGLVPGTYQLTPQVSIARQNVTMESILPGTVGVIISSAGTPTP